VKPVVFHPEARTEVREAVAYYELRRFDLATAFGDEVEEKVWVIRQDPQRWAKAGSSGARKCLLKRFPYSIYYLDQDHRIWIVAVAHQKRRPYYWLDRISAN